MDKNFIESQDQAMNNDQTEKIIDDNDTDNIVVTEADAVQSIVDQDNKISKETDLLCQYLIEQEKLKEVDFQKAVKLCEAEGSEDLTSFLTRLGLVSEKDVADGFAALHQLTLFESSDFPEVAVTNGQLPMRFLKKHHILPVLDDDDTLKVVMANPSDQFVIDALALATNKAIEVSVGVQTEIDDVIERLYGGGKSAMGQIVESLSGIEGSHEEDVEQLRDLASEAPVIRLVNLIMQRAVESRASDIHIEPFENRLKVRYRIDGVLKEVEAPPARSTAAVISRIKIMAKLNIAERRLPQDGRVMLRVQGKELDLRVSTVPTVYGESVVMRILDRESIVLDFAELGFNDDLLKRFYEVLHMPHGIILVTGPTGSGKTTTLYTALQKLNTPTRKIISVEDPVEYQLEGINQIQAKPSIGLNFASALRSIVRQDPDVIMIGEMRDLETAKIAIQSALTGHLVLSTIHTNDASGGVTRLLDMGVEDFLLTSTVNGILGQRLVRRLCPHCRESYTPLEPMIEELELKRYIESGPIKLYRAIGCDKCGGNGYKGRISILELLVVSDTIRQMVMKHADAGEIDDQARKEGMLTMYEDGIMKCLDGVTTFEEVLRVTQEG